MSARFLTALFTMIATLWLAPLPALGQAETERWIPPRTADGSPDIQGLFTFRTITPLQRPKELAGKATLNAEEAADFDARSCRRRSDRDRSPAVDRRWSAEPRPRR